STTIMAAVHHWLFRPWAKRSSNAQGSWPSQQTVTQAGRPRNSRLAKQSCAWMPELHPPTRESNQHRLQALPNRSRVLQQEDAGDVPIWTGQICRLRHNCEACKAVFPKNVTEATPLEYPQ